MYGFTPRPQRLWEGDHGQGASRSADWTSQAGGVAGTKHCTSGAGRPMRTPA